MTTLEDTIKQYEQRVVKIRQEADERIKEIEKHIKKLKAQFETRYFFFSFLCGGKIKKKNIENIKHKTILTNEAQTPPIA